VWLLTNRTTDRRRGGQTDYSQSADKSISIKSTIESVDWLSDVLDAHASIVRFRAVRYWTGIVSLCIGLVHEGRFYGFSRFSAVTLAPKWSNTKFVYFLGRQPYHKQHRSVLTVNGEEDLYYCRCLSIMYSFSATSANIAINDISLKLDSLDYIVVADSIGQSSTTLM